MKYSITISFLLFAFAMKAQNSFPHVIAATAKRTVKKEFNTGQEWYRPVRYIGPKKDTLKFSERSRELVDDYKLPYAMYLRLPRYSFSCDACIHITIDSSRQFSFADWELTGKKERLKRVHYMAYPAIIENRSDSIYKIGFAENVPVIVEAQDTDLSWKPIEIPYMYKCGTGRHTLYLQSKHIVAVLIPVYYGNFNTRLRLKLDNHYSASFMGWINREQFNGQRESFE